MQERLAYAQQLHDGIHAFHAARAINEMRHHAFDQGPSIALNAEVIQTPLSLFHS